MSALKNRANSSPNLRDSNYQNATNSRLIQDDDDDEFYVIGDRVYVDGHRAGSVAYFGETEFALGSNWVGVVLDEPTGQHGGKLHGREYFQCAPGHGCFVRSARVSRTRSHQVAEDSALGSSASSSRCATPTSRSKYWPVGTQRSSSRTSNGSSQLDSYYYDDDYRPPTGRPSVASLARKLHSIEEKTTTPKNSTMKTRGILKWPSASASSSRNQLNDDDYQHHEPLAANLSSRVDELSRRLSRANSSIMSSNTDGVLHFRPRREQLFRDNDNYIITGNKSTPTPEPPPRRRSVHLSPNERQLSVGQRVIVRTQRDGQLVGTLRFMGETNFATGEWAGVELDDPQGKHDGSILNVRYFYCTPNYGLFVPMSRVEKLTQSNDIANYETFNSMRSTIKSPPPLVGSDLMSRYSSRSTTPSYTMATLSPASSATFTPSPTTTTTPTHRDDYLSTSKSSSLIGRRNYFDDDDDYLTTTPIAPIRQSSLYANVKLMTSSSSINNNFDNIRRHKFDDRDIEIQLKKSLNRSPSPLPVQSSIINRSTTRAVVEQQHKPKAVEYTFISNKVDGNPIARKTLIYK